MVATISLARSRSRAGASHPQLCSLGLVPLLALAACGTNSPSRGARPPGPGDIPESVAVSGGTVEFGFALGKPRQAVKVDDFAISKSPITVGQYKRCIASGACSAPELTTGACSQARVPVLEGRTYQDSASADGLPVTCASPLQALNYCAWVGGMLPSPEQWMYAARGAAVQRFAWGENAPDCDRHPRAVSTDRDPNGCCAEASCEPAKYYAVGGHAAGASPWGLLDVLATPAELLRGADGSTLPACAHTGGACAIQGNAPGAIDFVKWISSDLNQPLRPEQSDVYGFRCVFEVKP